MQIPDGERRIHVMNDGRRPRGLMWALRRGDPKATDALSVVELKQMAISGWYKCIRISDGAILMDVNGCEIWRTDTDAPKASDDR